MKINNHDILKIEYQKDVPISQITTYKTQGFVKGVFYPKSEKEFITTYAVLREHEIPFIVIGNGSNFLISPKANILAISTKKLHQNAKFQDNVATFSASVNLSKAYSLCKQRGLSGFEKLAGVPATIGGAIKNNASCFGVSIFDFLEEIKIFDEKIKKISKKDVFFGYHATNLKNILILSASFRLKEKESCKIVQEFLGCQQARNYRQPKGFSCGSVFKNPQNFSAGKLIEDCGLKGSSHGGAIISPIHGNFILNQDNAKFEDVKSLIDLCQTTVKATFNIDLEREVEIIE